jgi:WD40 repeat protein
VRRWDATSGKQISQYSLEGDITFPGVALSPDETILAVATSQHVRAMPILLIDAKTGRIVRRFEEKQHGKGIAFSPDGRTLATSDAKGTILLKNPASGASLGKLEDGAPGCRVLAFSPDGKFLVSVHDDKIVRLWDRNTRRVIQRYKPANPRWQVGAVAFSSDSKILAAHHTGSIDLWDTATGERMPRGFNFRRSPCASLFARRQSYRRVRFYGNLHVGDGRRQTGSATAPHSLYRKSGFFTRW